MRIHHLALPEDWTAAQEAGEYRVSTRGVTVDEEGFIHASTPDQLAGTFERYYADRPDVVLLTIDTDLLTSPWRFDDVGDTRFPHVYGPITTAAVVEAAPYRA